jgi:hypothetical protein
LVLPAWSEPVRSEKERKPANIRPAARTADAPMSVGAFLALQRGAGNAAVARAVAHRAAPVSKPVAGRPIAPTPVGAEATSAQHDVSDSVPATVAPALASTPNKLVAQRGILDSVTSAVSGAVDSASAGLRSRVLDTMAGWARRMPGYGALCLAVGRDVITQQPVARDAAGIIGAIVGLIPGGAAVWENLRQSGAVARAGEWISTELTRLNLTWDAVRSLFSRAWNAVSASDLLEPEALWQRLSGLFGEPIVRLREFASAAGGKLMEFVFEGVLTTAGGAGAQVMAAVRNAGDVIGTIVRNPIGFAGNLVAAVRGGFGQFAGNILTHLRTGLIGWLTGALRGAVQLPQRFDLGGILTMVTSMLGLTWDWLRQRLVRTLGERVVRTVETAVDWVRTLVTNGFGGIVNRLGDMVGGLVETVIGGIRDWVANTVVGAAITRLISMFNPAGAVIQAILAVYNTVKFFGERAQQLGALAESLLGSIAAIAGGNIANAARAVEQALGRTIPVVLGFLARLIGLGDVATPVRNVINRIRGMIDAAVDRVVGWISAAARRLGGGRGEAAAPNDVRPAVRDATTMLNAPGATEASIRARLGDLRQRHGLMQAVLAPGGMPGSFHIHVQKAAGDTPDKTLGPPLDTQGFAVGDEFRVKRPSNRWPATTITNFVRMADGRTAATMTREDGTTITPIATLTADLAAGTKIKRATVFKTEIVAKIAASSVILKGRFAAVSIPSSGPAAKDHEKSQIQDLGRQNGCHSCGNKTPVDRFHADHQPPTELVLLGLATGPSVLYPQCVPCSDKQGGEVNSIKAEWQGKTVMY